MNIETLFMFYFKLSALVFLFYWLVFMFDQTTSKKDLLSWIVLILIALTFPISIPLSIFELCSKLLNKFKETKQKKLVPLRLSRK